MPRRMLQAALEAEVDGYIESLADQLDDEGHRRASAELGRSIRTAERLGMAGLDVASRELAEPGG